MRLATAAAAVIATLTFVYSQRITTIQLDGIQYFVSNQNPYSPKLNFFLAYQYCRSIGLQLLSLESQEKADSLTQYLQNAGYGNRDYWTSGNRLGTRMWIWMSSGQPFNATFNYMRNSSSTNTFPVSAPSPSTNETEELGTGRKSRDLPTECVTLTAPDHTWDSADCSLIKDFICEQTRCYYYNYGSINVSPSQGNKIYAATRKPSTSSATNDSSTSSTTSTITTPYPFLNFTVHRRITLRPAHGSVDNSSAQDFHKPDDAFSEQEKNSGNDISALALIQDRIDGTTTEESENSPELMTTTISESNKGKNFDPMSMHSLERKETFSWGTFAKREKDNNLHGQ